jgi:hypothetical protein
MVKWGVTEHILIKRCRVNHWRSMSATPIELSHDRSTFMANIKPVEEASQDFTADLAALRSSAGGG